jgi:hypothetical protein
VLPIQIEEGLVHPALGHELIEVARWRGVVIARHVVVVLLELSNAVTEFGLRLTFCSGLAVGLFLFTVQAAALSVVWGELVERRRRSLRCVRDELQS